MPHSVLLKYPNWMPKVCFACHRGLDRGIADLLPSPPAYYTDGAYSWSAQVGGWAAVRVEYGEVTRLMSGSASPTSNNRMELQGVIAALEDAKADESLVIWTDSQYTVNSITLWASSWEASGWTRGGKGEVKNLDLIQRAWYLSQAKPDVGIKWVRGHNGNHWNSYADSVASACSDLATKRKKIERKALTAS